MNAKTLTERDLSELYDGKVCVVCQESSGGVPDVVRWLEAHAAKHVADGGAVVLIDAKVPRGAKKRERIVPAGFFPEDKPTKPKIGRPKTTGIRLPKGFVEWKP